MAFLIEASCVAGRVSGFGLPATFTTYFVGQALTTNTFGPLLLLMEAPPLQRVMKATSYPGISASVQPHWNRLVPGMRTRTRSGGRGV